LDASRTPCQGGAGSGRANLRFPTGGLAYGILVKEENLAPLCVFLYLPSITPFLVFTSGLRSEELRFLMHFMTRPA